LQGYGGHCHSRLPSHNPHHSLQRLHPLLPPSPPCSLVPFPSHFFLLRLVHRSLKECACACRRFAEVDKVRTLPNCKHGFHTHCIDAWFASHSTCPLCRTPAQPAKGCSDNEPGLVPVSGAEEGCSSSLGPPIACPRKTLDVVIEVGDVERGLNPARKMMDSDVH
ncbi:RING-H2 finger protein ATL5-like, partial [Vigna umbellata]|uniref:RING-H2 finger protein ATL5-like n=1 Tax=Vigna umbellata TaxID=87088 RepID=UPI001F5F7CEA